MQLTVARAGFLTTVQDSGRSGLRQFGVSRGGALDRHGLRVANLLVGNPETSAGLEITSGIFRCRFSQPQVVAWVGGNYRAAVADMVFPAGRPALVRAGEELSLAAPGRGGRAWLAVAGGIDVPVVLGSRSTDLRGRFGGCHGRALRDGDVLPLGPDSARSEDLIGQLSLTKVASWSAPVDWSSTALHSPLLRVVRGTDWARFEPAAQRAFLSEKFIVSRESDRMGARLEGHLLQRKVKTDLISEAVVPGTVQVPPGGHPILLLGDCQTLGGYPKLAHVITVDLPGAAQLWPGQEVRFQEVSLEEAQGLFRRRAQDLAIFSIGLSLRL